MLPLIGPMNVLSAAISRFSVKGPAGQMPRALWAGPARIRSWSSRETRSWRVNFQHPHRQGQWIQLVWDAGHATVSGFRMIYHLSLQTAGFIAGVFLLLLGLAGLARPASAQAVARRLPRSRVAGFALLTLTFFWSFWLLATM